MRDASTQLVEVLEIRHEGDWARVLVEARGMIAICSSFGNWAFTFSAPSFPFSKFLAECENDYLSNKLSYQFKGKMTRRQEADLKGFLEKMWPVIREGLEG